MKKVEFRYIALFSALLLITGLALASPASAQDGTLISNPGPAMNSGAANSSVNTAPLTTPVSSGTGSNEPNRIDMLLEENRERVNEPNPNYYYNNRAPGYGNSSLDEPRPNAVN